MQKSDRPISKRAWYLTGILISLTLGVYFLLPSDPLIAAKMLPRPRSPLERKEYHPDDISELDQPIGQPFPQEGAGREIMSKTAFSERGYLIVGLGDCASCLHFDVRDWEQQSKEIGIPLIAYTAAGGQQIDKFKQTLHTHIAIYPDPANQLHKTLNAYWSGRVYYYDKDWKLRWKMTSLGEGKNLSLSTDLLGCIPPKKGTKQ